MQPEKHISTTGVMYSMHLVYSCQVKTKFEKT